MKRTKYLFASLAERLWDKEQDRFELSTRKILAGKTVEKIEPLTHEEEEKLQELTIETNSIFEEMQKYI